MLRGLGAKADYATVEIHLDCEDVRRQTEKELGERRPLPASRPAVAIGLDAVVIAARVQNNMPAGKDPSLDVAPPEGFETPDISGEDGQPPGVCSAVDPAMQELAADLAGAWECLMCGWPSNRDDVVVCELCWRPRARPDPTWTPNQWFHWTRRRQELLQLAGPTF